MPQRFATQMSMDDQLSSNLKTVLAENLKLLENFNEDVDYVAEYIVLLISNNSDQDSIVQELASLFDTVNPVQIQQIVGGAFNAVEMFRNGATVDQVLGRPAASTAPPDYSTAAPVAASAADSMDTDIPRGPRNARPTRGGISKGAQRGCRTNFALRSGDNLAKALAMIPGAAPLQVKKDERCPEFPHCPKGRDCEYGHPFKVCNAYPNCPRAPGTCTFLHPAEDEQLILELARQRQEKAERMSQHRPAAVKTGIVLCKFGNMCTNQQCPFGHPTPANEDAKVIVFEWCPENLNCTNPSCGKAHSSLSKIKEVQPMKKPPVEKSLEQCKFGNKCTNKRCKFRHARSHVMCRDGAGCQRIDCLFSHPINEDCKFGLDCKNAYCLYKHPEGRVAPQPGKNMTWTAERHYAVPQGDVMETVTQEGA